MDELSFSHIPEIFAVGTSAIAIIIGIFAIMACRTLANKLQQSLEMMQNLHQLLEHQNAEAKLQLKSIQSDIDDSSAKMKHIQSTQGVKQSALAENIEQLRSDFNQLQDAQLAEFEANPTHTLYANANELAKSGASIETIMEQCDLPRSEVELLVNLNAS